MNTTKIVIGVALAVGCQSCSNINPLVGKTVALRPVSPTEPIPCVYSAYAARKVFELDIPLAINNRLEKLVFSNLSRSVVTLLNKPTEAVVKSVTDDDAFVELSLTEQPSNGDPNPCWVPKRYLTPDASVRDSGAGRRQ